MKTLKRKEKGEISTFIDEKAPETLSSLVCANVEFSQLCSTHTHIHTHTD